MRNEITSGLSPEVSITESTPELWVENEDDLAEAVRIGEAGKSIIPAGWIDWVCPTYGERSEPQFASCWKCGTAKV